MTTASHDIATAILRILQPPARRWATPGQLAAHLDRTTVQTPALDLIDAELVHAADTPDSRLIISMPPQEGKSQRTSRRFPHWLLNHNPDTRIAIASYEHGVARRWGRAIRDDITSHPELGLRIRDDLAAQHEWQLSGHDGGVYSVGIGAALTGRPVDCLIIDDPIKDRLQADSKTYRDRVWDWWLEVGATRLAPGAPVVLILTRWHEDDLAGRLLAAEDGHLWRVVNIPAQAEDASDPLGRQPGEYMASARRRTTAQWEAIKTRSGSRTWSALYQGRPSPPEGGMLQRTWWRYWTTPPPLDGLLVQSWDLAFKSTSSSDFVVGQVWLKRDADCYLLDQVRGRWTFTETCQQIIGLSERWPQALAKYVEDKANGPAVIDALTRTVPGLIPVNPEGGKQARAAAVSPLIEAGNVWLPHPDQHRWVADLVEEAAAFPNASHDDQVDALTQALTRLQITVEPSRTGSHMFDIG